MRIGELRIKEMRLCLCGFSASIYLLFSWLFPLMTEVSEVARSLRGRFRVTPIADGLLHLADVC